MVMALEEEVARLTLLVDTLIMERDEAREALKAREAASVHDLLAQASGRIGAIEKGATMGRDGSGYKYRAIEQITERAQPIFAELGLTILPHKCISLDYVDVKNRNGTEGRHYLGMWRWRVYGPRGDYVTLEAPGECAEWGGDKGANKVMTASRKNALTTALNLAENRADPDSYESEESYRVRTEQPAFVPLSVDGWDRIKEARGLLDEVGVQQVRDWCEENGIPLSNRMSAAQGEAVLEKIEDIRHDRLRTLRGEVEAAAARAAQDADAEAGDPSARQEPVHDGHRAPVGVPADSGAAGAQPPSEGAVGDEELPPRSEWEMYRCDGPKPHDVKGYPTMLCPVPGCGGTLTDEGAW